MITLSTQHARSGTSRVMRVLTEAAAPLTPIFRGARKILTRYEYVHTIPLFHHILSVLILATVTTLSSFSKHSHLSLRVVRVHTAQFDLWPLVVSLKTSRLEVSRMAFLKC